MRDREKGLSQTVMLQLIGRCVVRNNDRNSPHTDFSGRSLSQKMFEVLENCHEIEEECDINNLYDLITASKRATTTWTTTLTTTTLSRRKCFVIIATILWPGTVTCSETIIPTASSATKASLQTIATNAIKLSVLIRRSVNQDFVRHVTECV